LHPHPPPQHPPPEREPLPFDAISVRAALDESALDACDENEDIRRVRCVPPHRGHSAESRPERTNASNGRLQSMHWYS
jgi:hypothetical protein